MLGSRPKIAGLVANTIANKVYFDSTLNLRTLKRYAGLLAIDHRCKVTKLVRLAPFSCFKTSSRAHLSLKDTC